MNKKVTLLIALCFLSYFVVIGCFIIIPETPLVSYIALGFSLLFTSVVVLLNKEAFSHFYQSKFFKKICENMVSVFLIFFILSLLNYLVYKNPMMWDISKRKNNSLTTQTKQILSSMKGELSLHVVSLKKDFIVIKQLTELYRIESSKVTVKFVDGELRPDLVKGFGVTKLPAIVLDYKARNMTKRKVVSSLREDQITTQVSNLIRGRELTFYFTEGHGEIDLQSRDNEGASAWLELMAKNSFIIKKVKIGNLKNVPKDMDVLVLWGPKSAYFESDLAFIDKVMKEGKSVMMALDPTLNKEDVLTSIRAWLKKRGLGLSNNLVIDKSNHVNGSKGTIPHIHMFNREHPLTKEASTDAFFPLVSGMETIEESSERIYWQQLAWSSRHPDSWGERNIASLKSLDLKYDDGIDLKGPLSYIAAYEKEKTKLLVFGNSSFVSNTYKKFTQNLVLVIAGMNWVGGETDTLSFDMPQVKDRALFIGDNQKGVIFYFSVIFLPLFLILVAFFLYRRRLS